MMNAVFMSSYLRSNARCDPRSVKNPSPSATRTMRAPGCGDRVSIQIERADRLLVADATDGLRKQARHRKLADARAALCGRRQRNRVRHDQLVERRLRNLFHGRAG